MKKFVIVVLVLCVILGMSSFSEPVAVADNDVDVTPLPTVYEPCEEHTMLDENYCCKRCGEYIGPRYGFTEEEVYLLTLMLCGSEKIDGDGEYDFVWWLKNDPDNLRYDQVTLPLCVVMNRQRDSRFPDTVYDILYAKNQFLVMTYNANKTPYSGAIDVVREWCEAYDRYDSGAQSIPENHVFYGGNGRINRSRVKY